MLRSLVDTFIHMVEPDSRIAGANGMTQADVLFRTATS